MKKAAVITLLLFEFVHHGFSQKIQSEPIEVDHAPKSLYLKVSPLALIASQIPGTGEFRLGLEMVTSPKVTTQISAGYLYKSPIYKLLTADTLNQSDVLQFPGYRFQAQIRYYYLKFYNKHQLSRVLLPSGLYVSLHTSYAAASLKVRNVTNSSRFDFTHFNVDVLAGTQLLYQDHLGLDAYMGIGYKNNVIAFYDQFGRKSFIDPSSFSPFYASPIKLTLGVSLTFGLF